MATALPEALLDAMGRQELSTEGELLMAQRDWRFVREDSLPHASACVLPDLRTVVLSGDTWETLAHDEDATHEFATDMIEGGGGMKYLVRDAGSFGRAARAEAAAKGTDVPVEREPLTVLAEHAQRLVLSAASLNVAATPLQLQMFSMRLGELEVGFAELSERLREVRSLLDLAGIAIIDAAG